MRIKKSCLSPIIWLLFPVMFALLLAACAPTEIPRIDPLPTAQQPDPDISSKGLVRALLGRTFILREVQDKSGSTMATDEFPITLTFDRSSVSGSSGCNQYGGNYTLEKNTLTISLLASTRMACMSNNVMQEDVMVLESFYLDLLERSTTLAMDADTVTLTYPSGKMVFDEFIVDSATSDQPITEPKNLNAPDERPLAQVDTISIGLLESFPVQAKLTVNGILPTPCDKISYIEQDLVSPDTIYVSIEMEKPDPAATCIAEIAPFQQIIDLDILGLEAGEYTVIVNGVSDTFTLDKTNRADE